MQNVAVIGAGLAGLTAARDLHRQGIDVVVLEAADRPGGRAMSETTTLGSRVDLGGQWLGHDHHRMFALAAELGLTSFPMHTGPMPVIVDGTRRVRIPSLIPSGLMLAAVELMSRLGTPRAWNNTTVQSWLQKVPGRTTRRLLEVIAYVSWTADLDRLSVHAMTRLIRHQGGLHSAMSTSGGAQDSLLVEGVGSIIEALATELGPRVRLGERVTSIVRDDDGVTVHSTTGRLRAAKVIVTVPPPMAARIAHEPPLPPERVALEQNTRMGSVYKAIAIYDRPFWRDRDGGEFLVLDPPGRAVFDTTTPDGPGHLCILIAGPEARQLDRLEPVDRRAAVLDTLTHHIGPEVREPADWHEKSWHLDEFVGGAYSALPLAGTFDGIPPITTALLGHIHWSGTETANGHPGYLDGAVESGTRAATEVAQALMEHSRA